MSRDPLPWMAVAGALALGFSAPAQGASDFTIKWAQEASAGKLRFDGKVTLPARANKGCAAQIEIVRTGEGEGSETGDIELKKKTRKLKYTVKGVAAGTYLVHVRVDMDADGAYGDGDLDGWYAGKGGEVVQTRDAAVAIEISKRKTKRLDFKLAPVAAAAAPAEAEGDAATDAGGAEGDGAAAEGKAAANKGEGEAGAGTPAAAPADAPAWVKAGSGPRTEGEVRTFVGVNFKKGSDEADARRRAQAALDNVVENFSVLVAGKYRADAKAAKKTVGDADVQAITDALSAATKSADAAEGWNGGGGFYAQLKVDLTAAVERVHESAGVSDDFKAWFAKKAVEMHTLFVQLQG